MPVLTDTEMSIMESDHITRTSGDMTLHTTRPLIMPPTLTAMEILTTLPTHLWTITLPHTTLNLPTRDTTLVVMHITMATHMREFSQRDTLR
jgi:hypothetical protein